MQKQIDAQQSLRRPVDQEPNWMFLTVVATLALIWLAGSLAPPPKLRASRISSVNTVQTVSLVITDPKGAAKAVGIPPKWIREKK